MTMSNIENIKSRPRCFIIEASKHDITIASEYGEIIYLFTRERGRSSIWSLEFRHELERAFEFNQFDSEVDYLVAVGAQVPLLIAVGVLLNTYESINVLVFFAPERKYIPIILGEINNATRANEQRGLGQA